MLCRPGVQVQNLRGALLYREVERNEQVALRVGPLPGVVVAPGQFALHLVHRPDLTGCDCVLDLRPQRAETPWAGRVRLARPSPRTYL